MHAAKLSGPAAHDLLNQAIAADHELELNRDIFERVYRRRYMRAYAHFHQHDTISRAVVDYCNAIIDKHPLR